MASQLKPFVFEQEGLFARRSSSNILSDPRILEHLRIVAEEAQQFEEADEENISDEDDVEFQKKDLSEKIAAYNKRNQFGAFRIVQNELNYEGAVRFYFEDGAQELTKAVRIDDKTTVAELLPILLQKFNFQHQNYQYILYVVHEVDEIALDDSDCPLTIAISALKIPRFVLRLKSKLSNNKRENSNSSQQNQSNISERFDSSSTTASLSRTSERDSQNSSKNVSISPGVGTTVDNKHQNAIEDKHKKPKRTRSFASMVKSKKKNANKQDNTELSTYKLAPGILKVFGDHVSPGSNYKSVRASTISTAKEVVKQALEKYGLEHANPNDFVLCDVVGHFKVDTDTKKQKDFEEAQWVTEYVRVVNDNEKPLVVQSLWKPAAGRLRRFELIKKIEMESNFFFINTADGVNRNSFLSSPSIDQTDSEQSSIVSADNIYHKRDDSDMFGDNTHAQLTPISSNGSKEGSQMDVPKIIVHQQQQQAPKSTPFLLLLKGYNADFDKVIYPLDKNTISMGTETHAGGQDVCLSGPDMFPNYCFMHRKISLEKGSHETNIDDVNFSMVVEPAANADVFVNGVRIEHSTLIRPGQLLSLGSDYCFLFKNPPEIKDSELKFSWLESLKQVKPELVSREAQTDGSNLAQGISEIGLDDLDQSTIQNNDATDNAVELNGGEKVAFKRSELTLSYSHGNEDDMLNSVIHCMDAQQPRFRLTPAYLLTMMVEHSFASFSDVRARKLLLKVSSALQGIAWEKTKEIGKQVPERKGDVIESLNIMLSELEPVVLWMSNALEMLHYLQCHLNRYIETKQDATSQQTKKESLSSADEELLTVLEEVIMFTFQQTVYHLTKILYSTLPAILDTNPFQNEDDDDDGDESVSTPPGVALIIEIFQSTLSLVSSHNVHPQIIVQLFAYLFFFTNASLFNSLMERGSGGKFYRWTKGVQIRGNLDVLEDWASQSGLQEQFGEHMKKIVAAVAMLSIPKAQLLQMDWNTIRDDYPDLNAAQVQQLLGEYQLGAKNRPRGWYPPPEEVEVALRSTDVLESFATHPPLLLPTSNFMMDLNKLPEDRTFEDYLSEINTTYGVQDEVKPAMGSEEQVENAIQIAPTVSQVANAKQPTGPTFSVSIQPSHTSTPQRINTASNEANRSPRSSSDSSSTLPLDQPRGYSFDGDADISEEDSNAPDLTKKRTVLLKKDEVMMQHRQPSSPVPHKKAGFIIQRDILISDDGNNNVSDDENADGERKTSLLGSTKSIQISARKSPSLPRRADNIKQSQVLPKSDVLHAESGGRQGNGKSNGVVVSDASKENSLALSDYVFTDDTGIVGDVDFTSNSHSEDVMVVELVRGDKGLGLGLIDGLITPLEAPGIYIRTIVSGSPAAKDGRIKLGDRILAVNGTSLVGSSYASAMDMIINAGSKLSFLVSKSDHETIDRVISSQC
eukprot:gene9188-10162_t